MAQRPGGFSFSMKKGTGLAIPKKGGFGSLAVPKKRSEVTEEPPLKQRKTITEDDYFDDDDDDVHDPPPQPSKGADDDEVDPLDAFMAGVTEDAKAAPTEKTKEERLDNDDYVDSYIEMKQKKALENKMKKAGAPSVPKGKEKEGSGVCMSGDYDSDSEVYAAAKEAAEGDEESMIRDRKMVESLPPLDHSKIEYYEFNKAFYEEAEDIASMSFQDVERYRRELDVRITGIGAVRPVRTFQQLGLGKELLGAITKHGYSRPTPIQCQAVPIGLSGRDLIGIAKTGSGKTAAYVLPMIVHIMDQPELEKGDGPIALVVCPTRELASQITTEAKKFAKPYGLKVANLVGGMSKYEQAKELRQGAEIAVGTPGRMIDMIKLKACPCFRVTFLVLDEADRMFNLGFEPQVRSIIGQLRPDRQTLLFSATFKKSVELLARDSLSNPIKIQIGAVGVANKDVKQVVEVMSRDDLKIPWLLNMLPGIICTGNVMIFAGTKDNVEKLAMTLQERDFEVAALHGDRGQAQRDQIMKEFKSENVQILICTDVASRGLDIKSVKTVINYDVARDIDSHVHRIGRTGRAGALDGTAYTLVTHKDTRFAGDLINNLQQAGQDVPQGLHEVAMKDPRFGIRGGRRGGGRGAPWAPKNAGVGYGQRFAPQSSAEAASMTKAHGGRRWDKGPAGNTNVSGFQQATETANDFTVGRGHSGGFEHQPPPGMGQPPMPPPGMGQPPMPPPGMGQPPMPPPGMGQPPMPPPGMGQPPMPPPGMGQPPMPPPGMGQPPPPPPPDVDRPPPPSEPGQQRVRKNRWG